MSTNKPRSSHVEPHESEDPTTEEVAEALQLKGIVQQTLYKGPDKLHPLVTYFRKHGQVPEVAGVKNFDDLKNKLANHKGDVVSARRDDANLIKSQLINLSLALFAGVKAAEAIKAEASFSDLEGEEVKYLTRCLEYFELTWDLKSPTIPLDKATALATPVSAIDAAITSCFQLEQTGKIPTWFNESNYLTVRRLLRYLLGHAETEHIDPGIGKPTDFNRFVILGAGNDDDGATYVVEARRFADEPFPSFYLDPISLGVRYLDASFVASMRIAARVCRTELYREMSATRNAKSLRISPRFGETLAIDGGSAGGIIACGAIATAWGERLNQQSTATITISAPNSDENNREETLSKKAIEIGEVNKGTIRNKLAAAKRAGLTDLHFHENQEIVFDRALRMTAVKSRLESEYQGIRFHFHPTSDFGVGEGR